MASTIAAWPMVPLGEVLMQVSRAESVQADKEYRLLGIRLDGNGPFLRETKLGGQIAATTLSRVEAGDFIYSRLFAWRGAFGTIDASLDGSHVSGEFPTFRPVSGKLDIEFLRLWFRLPSTLAIVEADCTGSTPLTRNRFKEHFFLTMQIPLPPLDEQRRIVARIEGIAARIEEAKGLRREALAEAEALKRSTLNQQFARLQMVLRPVRLDTVAECRLGKMLSQQAKMGVHSTPYLRNANIQWDRLDLSDVFEMDFDEEERHIFQLREGDILVCEGGDIGKAAIWNDEIPGCCYQKALHRVRVDQDRSLPRFILYHIFWHSQQGHFEDVKTQTTIAHLTGVKLKASETYVPSKLDQQRIVAHLDAVNAMSTELKQQQTETEAGLDAILQSVLDKAFRGEL